MTIASKRVLGRLVALARRPALWAWLAAAATAAGVGISPELRELLVAGLPALVAVLAGG